MPSFNGVKEGARVGAIHCSNKDGTIQFFGYGVYEGDQTPDDNVLIFGSTFKELKETVGGDFATTYKNPRIKLDSGAYVFGCECWWASEEKVQAILLKAPGVVPVDIVKLRADVLGQEALAQASPDGGF